MLLQSHYTRDCEGMPRRDAVSSCTYRIAIEISNGETGILAVDSAAFMDFRTLCCWSDNSCIAIWCVERVQFLLNY